MSDEPVTQVVDLLCFECATGSHRAEVWVDSSGWPETKWIGPHRPRTREAAVADLAEVVSKAVAVALDADAWRTAGAIVEKALATFDRPGAGPPDLELDPDEEP